MKNLFSLLLFTSCLLLVSCKGEQGETGPAGADGKDGNANIMSFTKNVQENDWVLAFNGQVAYFDVQIPELDAEILNKGLIMVYFKDTDINAWTAWPYSLSVSDFTVSYSFFPEIGYVELGTSGLNTDAPTPNGIARIVLASAQGLAQHPKLDWTDYEAVQKAIQDVE